MHPNFNRFELENYAQRAADAFINNGVDLNDTITKMAEENGFTSHHIDRVVQNANIFVNGALVNKARESGDDPRVAFPLAKSAEISDRMSGGQDKVAGLRKEAEVIDLFTVRKQAADDQKLLDGTVGKMAPDPYADHARSVDHVKLAEDFVRESGEAQEMAKVASTASLSLTCQTLESLEQRALTDHNMAKNAMFEAGEALGGEIRDQILYGLSPATIRDVVKQAGLDPRVGEYVDGLVTKVAASLRAREGKSSFADGSLVNRDHPLISKIAEAEARVQDAIRTQRGLDKLSSAHKAAHEHYVRAAREGR